MPVLLRERDRDVVFLGEAELDDGLGKWHFDWAPTFWALSRCSSVRTPLATRISAKCMTFWFIAS